MYSIVHVIIIRSSREDRTEIIDIVTWCQRWDGANQTPRIPKPRRKPIGKLETLEATFRTIPRCEWYRRKVRKIASRHFVARGRSGSPGSVQYLQMGP